MTATTQTTRYAVVPNQGHYGSGAKIQPLFRSDDLTECVRQARRLGGRVIARESDSDNEVLCLGYIADKLPDVAVSVRIGCCDAAGNWGWRDEGDPAIPQWAAEKAARGDNDQWDDGPRKWGMTAE